MSSLLYVPVVAPVEESVPAAKYNDRSTKLNVFTLKIFCWQWDMRRSPQDLWVCLKMSVPFSISMKTNRILLFASPDRPCCLLATSSWYSPAFFSYLSSRQSFPFAVWCSTTAGSSLAPSSPLLWWLHCSQELTFIYLRQNSSSCTFSWSSLRLSTSDWFSCHWNSPQQEADQHQHLHSTKKCLGCLLLSVKF